MVTTEKTRIPLAEAMQLADQVVELMRGVCDRVEIAGSIRRKKETVGDVEIVCIPKLEPVLDLFGEVGGFINHQYEYSKLCREQGVLQPRLDVNDVGAWGERYQRAIYKGFPLDIFCVLSPAQWGVIFMLRTGPETYSRRMVTSTLADGRLSIGMQVKDGQLIDRGAPIAVPEEIDFYRLTGIPYAPPEDRF